MDDEPGWLAEHLAEKMTDPVACAAWVRERPAAVQALMLRFPPMSVVRANRTLVCPLPGMLGIVRKYTEKSDGTITVGVSQPETGMTGECDPEWLELVACRADLSVEAIREMVGTEP